MRSLHNTPLDEVVVSSWSRLDASYKSALPIVLGVHVLAYGFEMANLTLHHDDVRHIFIRDTILGHYLGRFGFGWLHYHIQNARIIPFLQMAQGMVLMSAYGLLTAHLWGMRKTMDIVIVASTMCVFPYMAQIYQYNSSIATFPVAHVLAALAVFLSVRATAWTVGLAALAYTAAFSIYQSVIANAAAIFSIWTLSQLLFSHDAGSVLYRNLAKSALAAIIAVAAGGLLYLAAVAQMHIEFDAYQGAGDAFSFKQGLQLSVAVPEVLRGTRSFFFWPEHYFPDYLKKLQVVFLAAAALACAWIPKGAIDKLIALAILGLSLFTPRLLQFLHPTGQFHNLTLTAYAVVVAGTVMVLLRAGPVITRNLSALLAIVLLGGYLIQCNWISTVSHLNTLAHYSTMTQILTRVKSLPREDWDGRTVIVFGKLRMYSEYPFLMATGVAAEFIDAGHAQKFGRLLREDIAFLDPRDASQSVRDDAARRPPWPHPDGIGVTDGVAVLVLSKSDR